MNYIGDEGDPGAGFKGVEKRRSHRYNCEGNAELREERRDVRTWATFQDVSLHGCYMEVQATYRVGTILQMKLDANGVQVETKGVVRVNYPYLGMGIAFREMSEPSVARLRELLSKISRRTVGTPPGMSSSLASGATLGLLAHGSDLRLASAGSILRKSPSINARRVPQHPAQEPKLASGGEGLAIRPR